MDNSNERQQKIDDKLLGRLEATAESELDRQLAEDASLQAMLDDTELARQAIEVAEDQVLKARLQELEGSLAVGWKSRSTSPLRVIRDDADQTESNGQVVPFYRRHFYALAACLLFLLAAGIYFILPNNVASPQELYAANFEPYRNIAVDITRGEDNLSVKERAFLAYEQGNYREALTYLGQLEATPVNDFYAGQAQLGLKKFPAAIDDLFPLAQMDDFPLQQQANWYLALAYLGNEATADAKQILSTIAGEEGHPFQKQAEVLLEEIE
ncbi:hypothetical protein CEQ90_06770 [Lewinellaceae bacterium SD302]|nr:hypothetical protein CEQ90_06770 [Lewinellaceae bacterium SD302]